MIDHKVAMATKDTDRGGLLVDAVVIGAYFHGCNHSANVRGATRW